MATMPCDLLVFAPHPDDAELHAGGIIARHLRLGASVVVADASAGELGSRGTVAQRAAEAAEAAAVLGLRDRVNLGLPDGGLNPSCPQQRLALARCLRQWQPTVVLGIHGLARHPDHVALAALLPAALKLAGSHSFDSAQGPAHQGARLWYYEAELPVSPDLLVPLTTADWARKMQAVLCHRSQFGHDGMPGPSTGISSPGFLPWIEARGRVWGHQAGADYAEALLAPEAPRIADLRGV